jgi:hypothetical protein
VKKYKYTGTVLAVITLIVLLTANVLLAEFDAGFNLCFNGLSCYTNFILLLLIAILYISFPYLHNKFIPFVISAFVLQNLLISGIVDLYSRSEDYDILNDFSYLIAIPVAIIGMTIWGIIFDALRNNGTLKDTVSK